MLLLLNNLNVQNKIPLYKNNFWYNLKHTNIVYSPERDAEAEN